MKTFDFATRMMALTGLLAGALMLFSGCAALLPTMEVVRDQPVLAQEVYLANNIHAEQRNDQLLASYANWTDTHMPRIIPVNSLVTVHEWREGLAIRVLDDDDVRRPVIVEYHRGRMRMSREEYVEEITSDEETDLADLSEIDREGIEEGSAKIGMSKDGVRIALGYPARHETPSLDDNIWTYWRNRWARYNVVFDNEGKVREIQD